MRPNYNEQLHSVIGVAPRAPASALAQLRSLPPLCDTRALEDLLAASAGELSWTAVLAHANPANHADVISAKVAALAPAVRPRLADADRRLSAVLSEIERIVYPRVDYEEAKVSIQAHDLYTDVDVSFLSWRYREHGGTFALLRFQLREKVFEAIELRPNHFNGLDLVLSDQEFIEDRWGQKFWVRGDDAIGTFRLTSPTRPPRSSARWSAGPSMR